MEYPLSVDDIAERTGINASSVRRYVKMFELFIPSVRINRKRSMYAEEAVPIVKRIGELYEEGNYTPAIYDVLRREFPMTIVPTDVVRLDDPDGSEDIEESDETALAVSGSSEKYFEEFQRQIDEFVALAEVFIEKTQRIEQHDSEIKTLRHDLIDTRTQFTGYVDQLASFERMLRDRASADAKLDAAIGEIRENAVTIREQTQMIERLNKEIVDIRNEQQQRPPSFLDRLKQTFGVRID